MSQVNEDLMINVKREEDRERYVKSQLSYHTVGKYKNKEYQTNVKPDRTSSLVYVNISDQITECMKEMNLSKRIDMFKKLSLVVHRASKPYIDFLIRKYTKKMEDESW